MLCKNIRIFNYMFGVIAIYEIHRNWDEHVRTLSVTWCLGSGNVDNNGSDISGC